MCVYVPCQSLQEAVWWYKLRWTSVKLWAAFKRKHSGVTFLLSFPPTPTSHPSFLPPSFHLTVTSYWCKISILRKIIRELSLLSDIIGTFADLLYNDNVPKVSLHIHTNCFLLSIYRKILACPKPLHAENLGGKQLEIFMVEENMPFSNSVLELVGCYSFGRLGTWF